MDFTVSQSGIIKGDKVFSLLKKIIKDEKLRTLTFLFQLSQQILITIRSLL